MDDKLSFTAGQPSPPPGTEERRVTPPTVHMEVPVVRQTPTVMPVWWNQMPSLVKMFMQFGFAGVMTGAFIMMFMGLLGIFKEGVNADRARADQYQHMIEDAIKDRKEGEKEIKTNQLIMGAKLDAALVKLEARAEKLDGKLDSLSGELRSVANAVTALASEVRASRQKAESSGTPHKPLTDRKETTPAGDGSSFLKQPFKDTAPSPRDTKGG